jgi:hypothetical protein
MGISKFIIVFAYYFIFIFLQLPAQIVKVGLSPNESLTLNVSYSWGIIKIPAGELNFQSSTRFYNNRQVAYFEATGKSYPAYDHIYKVCDRLQSFSEPDKFLPLWFEKRLNQNGHESIERYEIISSRKVIYSWSFYKNEIKNDTLSFGDNFFDFLTAAYNIRHINYSPIKIGEKIFMNVICDNKFYPIYVKYLGLETLRIDEKEYIKCLKLSISVISGDIFNDGEAITAWVTDDVNRLPVQLEAKILIGSVIARLVKAENTRKPIIVTLQ